jgi:hypothetical protein
MTLTILPEILIPQLYIFLQDITVNTPRTYLLLKFCEYTGFKFKRVETILS